jgi:hypothetical protein
MGGLSRFIHSSGPNRCGPTYRCFNDILGKLIDMDRDSSYSLSPEEAKAKLRAAGQELSLNHLIGRSTWSVLAVSLVGGYVVGRMRIPAMTGNVLMQRIAPLLIAVWLQKYKGHK